MAEVEYKALTVVNLPFIEERYEPGSTIPHSKFEEVAERAAALLEDRTAVDPNASPIWSAEDHVAQLMEGGSISDDLGAELHPDHLPVDPNEMTVAATVARVRAMVEQMEEAGFEIPAKMREFAEMSDKQVSEADSSRRMVSTSENGRSGDRAGK